MVLAKKGRTLAPSTIVVVPELTRNATIKLNAPLSLLRCFWIDNVLAPAVDRSDGAIFRQRRHATFAGIYC
jgi:hypothetical protein